MTEILTHHFSTLAVEIYSFSHYFDSSVIRSLHFNMPVFGVVSFLLEIENQKAVFQTFDDLFNAYDFVFRILRLSPPYVYKWSRR